MLFPPIFLALLLEYSHGLSDYSLVEEQWQEFKLKHNRIYASEDEDRFRMTVFMDNMHTILEHNKLYEMGASTYRMGMNQFGDLTDGEFRRYYTAAYNSTTDETKEESPREYLYLHSDVALPNEIDWRLAGAVSKVKNVGSCDCAYAFSALGALEAQYFFTSAELVPLSEQNIVDCTYKTKKYNNKGCSGGWVSTTYQYIIDNQGVDTEESYPYKGFRSRRCHFSPDITGARMSSYVRSPPGKETELQKAVALIGPVTVMVDSRNMRFYSEGIYNDPSCSSKEYNGNMLVIGYGKYENVDYWIVKNFWGVNWGENGYIRMIRNKGNQCAIASAAIYPSV